MSKPIGISEYELTRALPVNLQSALPTGEQIEAELGKSGARTTRVTVKRQSNTKQRKRARGK